MSSELVHNAVAKIRDHVNELEQHLLDKSWEAARTHASTLLEMMETMIDNIDEGTLQ